MWFAGNANISFLQHRLQFFHFVAERAVGSDFLSHLVATV